MGATITCGKKVGVVVLPDGRLGYLLFEQTYEKNVYPHTPQWSCIGLGFASQLIQRIFRGAASCEGGSLQGRNGCITPEGYIRGWMSELAAPTPMYEVSGNLVFNEYWRSILPVGEKDAIRARLEAAGRMSVFRSIEAGGYFATLADDFELLSIIYGADAPGPWRFVTRNPPDGSPNPSLGYSPARSSVVPKVATPPMFRLDRKDENLLQLKDGRWQTAGWAYSIIGSHVVACASLEEQYPGSYRTLIRAYRDACESAPVLPDQARVDVTPGLAEGYRADGVRSLADAFGLDPNAPFSVTLGDVRRHADCSTLLYLMASLDHAADWHPAATSLDSHGPAKAPPFFHGEQQALALF